MNWIDKIKEFFGFSRSRYEDLIAPPMQPMYRIVTPYEIQTIRIERVLPKEEVEIIGEDGIKDLFAREFSEYLKGHMLLHIYPNEGRYVGELTIALSKQDSGDKEP